MATEGAGSPVSNSAVVEELVAGLKTCLRQREEAGAPEASVTSTPANPSVPERFERPDIGDYGPTSRQDDDSVSDVSESEDDSSEEMALKEAEAKLTEEQSAQRRLTAEELKMSGNNAFKCGDYELSKDKYTEGLRLCPLAYGKDRAVLYCNRSAAKMKLEMYAKAVSDCTKSLELDDKYLKAYVRRAQSYELLNKFDESLSDYKKILELAPANVDAQRAVTRLPPLIEERNEKLKTEMLGKLKDIGNMILKPFGLSTDNFQLNQDPNTQGYNINFKQ